MLGMWKNGKLVYKKHKAETKTRPNCYGNWLKDIIEHRRKTGQFKKPTEEEKEKAEIKAYKEALEQDIKETEKRLKMLKYLHKKIK